MQKPISEEEEQKTIDAAARHRRPDGSFNISEMARDLELTRATIQARCRKLAERGLLGYRPVMPGFNVSETSVEMDASGAIRKQWVRQKKEPGEQFQAPSGHIVKGVSALLDPENRILAQWIKTKEGAVDPLALAESLKATFEDWRPSYEPVQIANDDFEDTLTLLPWADPHFGLRTWLGDTAQNWDLKIAVKTFLDTFSKVIARCPKSQKAILLVGGDTTHADDNRNITPRSGAHLDVDGRQSKVFFTACETIVEVTYMMLGKFEEVEIINLIGNHNENSADPISFFLHAWFRSDARVTVDTTSHIFKFRKYGKCMFGFTHGHTAKAKDMHTIMSHYEPKIWGATEYRAAHVFHVHHKSQYVSEHGGCVTETHQVMCPPDQWHYASGYKSGRSQQAIIYDKNNGEVGRIRVSVV
jgi:hypothetical protein